MFPLMAGAGAGVLGYLTSLLQSSTANIGGASGGSPLSSLEQTLSGVEQSAGQTISSQTGTGFSGLTSPFDAGTLNALISLQGQASSGAGSLFSQLQSGGTISKTDFENAMSAEGVDTASADALFNKLDSNDDGTLSKSDLAQAHHGHGHHHMGGAGQMASSLLNATGADGSTSQTLTNQDGSTTTTITYADGSTVTMTTPAAQNGGTSGGGSGAPGQSNLLEQLIQMQSQFIAQTAPGLSTLV
jgi:hypothetical protein